MASNYKNNGNGSHTIYEGNITRVVDSRGNTVSKTYIDAGGTKRTEHYSNGKHVSTTSTFRNGQTLTSESNDAFRERMRTFRENQKTPQSTFLDSLIGKKKR